MEETTTPLWAQPEMMLAGLVFVAVVSVGIGIALAMGRARRAVEPRLRAIQENGRHPLAETTESAESNHSVVERVGQGLSHGGSSQKLKEELARAGFYGRGAPAAFLGYKMVLLSVGLLVAMLMMLFSGLTLMVNVVASLSVAGLFFFLPNMVVGIRQSNRCTEIREALPDAVDLLEVGVTAGMGLDMAWNAVTDEIRRVSPMLADEMALTNLEMQLGASRSDAMRHMASRTGAEELSSLVALLVQSDRFGTSVGETLRTFAGAIREHRSQRAEESAEKMAVKLLIPMVICIFPVMLIVMVGPAGLTIFRMMGEN